jgi:hypothetical protein
MTRRYSWLVAVFALVFSESLHAQPPPTLFVLNAPIAASAGNDFVLAYTSRGAAGALLPASRGVTGARDIACDPLPPNHLYVAVADSDRGINEVQVLDRTGKLVDVLDGFGPAGGGSAIAFDDDGVLYVATNSTLFRDGAPLASIPEGIGKIATDSASNVYLTRLFGESQLLRVTPGGAVQVVADASAGLNQPFGIAIDSDDAIFVANAVPSAPATIIKVLPTGVAELFAGGISAQPGPRGLSFDLGPEGRLYAALTDDNAVVSFDRSGNSDVFADEADGILLPADVEWGVCPIDLDNDGVPDHEDECPGSSARATVLLGKCDSGIPNRTVSAGCRISDLVGRCSKDARNRGQAVSCVAKLAQELRKMGIVESGAVGKIQRCTGRLG